MVRSILAVVVSYVAMFVLEFIAFTCAYLIAGADFAFKPGVYEASTAWIGLTLVLNIVVSIIGGFICILIAKRGKAPLVLAIVAVVLGIVVALADSKKGQMNAGMVRGANTPQLEAVQKAYWPVWVPFTFPFISAIGILSGSKLKRS